MQYSEKFRAKMVAKMVGPTAVSATALSKQVEISQPTLSKWLRCAKREAMEKMKNNSNNSNSSGRAAKRPQDWSAPEKLALVIEANGLADKELGGFLRGHGLRSTQLQQWRRQMLGGLDGVESRKSSKRSPEAQRIRQLEKELTRKEKALAEAAALLVLKKKAEAMWPDEGENTLLRRG